MSRKKKSKKSKDSTTNSFNGLMSGGFANSITGAGGAMDKTEYSYFSPTRLTSRSAFETLYNESWACGKFIDIPIDDMFLKWREFVGMEPEAIRLMEEAEKEFKVTTNLSAAMKSGNLYGTGILAIFTKDSAPDQPLNPDRMLPGDLVNILPFDRFDLTVQGKDWDIMSPNFGQPLFYRIQLKMGGSITIHHSKVLRFDGKTPLTANGWSNYDQDWGVSDIIPVTTEIMTDANIAQGGAHLVNEASIPVQKIEDFADAVAGDGDCEMTIAQRMQAVTLARSIYRTVYMDKNEDLTRLDVNFAGLPDLMDRYAKRLAASKDIPATRFWGQAPLGLNATGDGDMKNYAIRVDSEKVRKLTDPLFVLDQVLAAHKGVNEPVQYEFPSLIDVSDSEQVDILTKAAAALTPLTQTGTVSEDEARVVLSRIEFMGELEERSEEVLEEIESFRQRAEQAQSPQMDSKKGFWSKIFRK